MLPICASTISPLSYHWEIIKLLPRYEVHGWLRQSLDPSDDPAQGWTNSRSKVDAAPRFAACTQLFRVFSIDVYDRCNLLVALTKTQLAPGVVLTPALARDVVASTILLRILVYITHRRVKGYW